MIALNKFDFLGKKFTLEVMKDVCTINEAKNNDYQADTEQEELDRFAEKYGKFEQDNY